MHQLSAIELRDKFARGAVSAVAIVEHFLARIERLDPQIGAFLLVLKERARAKAKELDAKKAAGEKLGKLAGVPVALKDNMHIHGEISTCASKFLTNYRAPFDATVTKLLEAEDAIIIGKTNLDEFAMGSSTENSALQVTRNPWNHELSPGGSSGGSAAAVAARLCCIALGSDTGGSIRQPASFCGIMGFKPTYGRVSRFGLVAFGSSLDQIGPLTYTVADGALAMEVLGRHCEKDSTSIAEGPEEIISHFNASIAGKKIGVPWEYLKDFKGQSRERFEKALEVYCQLGAEIVDVDLSLIKYTLPAYYIIAPAEASTNLARFDGIRYGVRSKEAKTLREVYDLSKEDGYGTEVKRRIMIGTYVLSAGFQDAYYRKAQKLRTLLINQFQAAFKKCDVISMPTTPDGAFKRGAIKDPLQMYLEDVFTIAQNLAGVPAISIPSGFTSDGRPLGIQLIGNLQCEKEVFLMAHAFEQKTKLTALLPEGIA